MVEPALADGGETDAETPAEPEETEEPDEDVEETTDDEVEMVQTDVETTGADPDGFFDDVETDSGGDTVDNEMFDGLDDSDGSSGDGADDESRREPNTSLADNINRGFARAAVIGLDDSWETEEGDTKRKDDLREEFEETFEAFRLGHYGSICAEEYLQMDDDVHPAWGLLGAALICSAVIVYKRPDGGDLVETTKLKLGETNLSSLKDKMTKGDDSDDGGD